jgi:hypothetical protein
LEDVENAKKQLREQGFACVICRGKTVYASTLRGVAFLMELYQSGTRLDGFSAADKVVGKASAMLMVLLGIQTVHAIVMSRPAAKMFDQSGVSYTYDTITDRIINRAGTGTCPMEQAVSEIDEPALAPQAIKRALKRLREASDNNAKDHTGHKTTATSD